jgi:hypothetical protein
MAPNSSVCRTNAIENGRYPLQGTAVLSLAIGNLT